MVNRNYKIFIHQKIKGHINIMLLVIQIETV